jgi:hypothetical protein
MEDTVVSMRKLSWHKIFLAAIFLLSAIYLMVSGANAIADDDHHKRHKQRNDKGSSFLDHGKANEGNEFTGESAAWIFAAANLTVVFSLLARGLTRYAPLAADVKDRVKGLNQTQKNHLMRFHYFLNPLALILAFIHFGLSRCRSTSLPEWGLVVMAILAGIGMMVKYKVSPKGIRRTVYQIHTNPFLLGCLLLLLLIGHSIID